ncbi:MAG: putative GNAT family acetyltransferase [Rhodothermales bacterium]|jgi:predicted GNAT family acetyltransferase
MISLHPCPDLSSIQDLKAEYLSSLVGPMDGMWDAGFTDPAPHSEIRVEGALAGYYAATDEGTLLQLHVTPAFEKHRRSLLDHVIAQGTITEAVVSTIDPPHLSCCLDRQKSVTVHTYLYEIDAEVPPTHAEEDGLTFRLLKPEELERTISLQQTCLGGEDDLSDWLRGYSANLIKRQELFVLSRDDDWIAVGECRRSDSQAGVADLGVMVNPDHRSNGWATYILTRLRADSKANGERSICSTEVENVAAQKAIGRAGFVSRHRILNVTF